MKTDFEQRLQRLEDKVFENDENDFVLIDIPGAKFKMSKRQVQDGNGERLVNVSYENAMKHLASSGHRLMTFDELRAMRNYAIQKIGTTWRNREAVEELFGISDMNKDEWIYECNEVAGLRWYSGADAGPFCADLSDVPSAVATIIGFRCCAAPDEVEE